jgi:hypothetical protein
VFITGKTLSMLDNVLPAMNTSQMDNVLPVMNTSQNKHQLITPTRTANPFIPKFIIISAFAATFKFSRNMIDQ